ncbi:class I SAM-dependent methyltransferase [Thalassospira sp.]|uniref:class I SAM-dependent methyltransferase n=1 Tax=Thalassospira sp. TaxID=1912094 RepID=UPI0027344DCA|nr:class I SAM-dependent methyltransferase [Thalassospira sp.]MDP2696658.1 tetratricopeptide repeat protein [Thalassospira sp.]
MIAPAPPPAPSSPENAETLAAATRHHGAGQLVEAAQLYQQVLAIEPTQPVALHLLGMILHQTGNNDRAVELLQKSLAVAPNYFQAHNNLGVVYNAMDRTLEAETSYRKAIAINPGYAEAHKNLGALLATGKKTVEALKHYQQTVTLNPNHAEAHKAIGDLQLRLKKPDLALESYLRAQALQGYNADLQTAIGITLQHLGRNKEALIHHSRAISMSPGENQHWLAFGDCVKGLSFTTTDDNLEKALLDLLERPDTRPAEIMFPTISALRCQPDFHSALEIFNTNPNVAAAQCLKTIDMLSGLPLFLRLLNLVPIAELRVERMLTQLRRHLLTMASQDNNLDALTPFIATLAEQCFANEYAWFVTEPEKDILTHIHDTARNLFAGGNRINPGLLALIGCYDALHVFDWASAISSHDWPDTVANVISRQVTEPRQEQALRTEIPDATGIQDEVSQVVRAQYEENPYPRWIRTALLNDARSVRDILTSSPLGFDLGDYQSPESPEILVAGCGTGQHALQTSARFANARVTAIDLSLSSLCYAARKTREMNIDNIEYMQADILKLGQLDRQFDIIECGGVLHHMADPLAGWKVLTSLLRPGGLMKIGLYSETGRPDVIAAREFIAKRGYASSTDDMRRCRQDIIVEAEKGDQNLITLCMRSDFFSLSPCRDLIFHVQEHRFTLPQIESALKQLDLTFIDFETPTPQPLIRFRQENRGCPDQERLARWHKFEEQHPETFRGMYQFWCQKPR